MRTLTLGIIIALAATKSAMALEPFGIPPGTPTSLLDVDESSDHRYRVEVPKPHPEFPRYVVHSTPKAGTCLIRAIGRNYRDDPNGERVREAFDRIRDQVKLRYGEGQLIDSDRWWSFRDAGDEWLSEIRDGKRAYQFVWDREAGAKMPSGLVEILLTVNTASALGGWIHPFERDTSYLTLQYRFHNYEECQSELAAESDEKRLDEAEAF